MNILKAIMLPIFFNPLIIESKQLLNELGLEIAFLEKKLAADHQRKQNAQQRERQEILQRDEKQQEREGLGLFSPDDDAYSSDSESKSLDEGNQKDNIPPHSIAFDSAVASIPALAPIETEGRRVFFTSFPIPSDLTAPALELTKPKNAVDLK